MVRIATSSRHHPLYSRRRVIAAIPLGAQKFLAAFEGIEGGFAVGASVIVALSLAGLHHEILIVTALITIIVSGFNSAAVKYVSEHYLDELDGREKRSPFKYYFLPALIEFACYMILGIVTIVPIMLLQNTIIAVATSCVITLLLLFLAGFWRGYVLRMGRLKDAFETVAIGVGIIAIGAISGYFLGSL